MDNPVVKPVADVEKFQAAYREWRAATEAFHDRVLEIVTTKVIPGPEIERLCDELEAKRQRYMELSKPFVHWR